MGWFSEQAEKTRQSIKRVWSSDYPKWLWIVNAAVGILAGVLFAIYGFEGSDSSKAGVGIAVAICGALIFFGFSYGVVRARGHWGKTPGPSGGFGGK